MPLSRFYIYCSVLRGCFGFVAEVIQGKGVHDGVFGRTALSQGAVSANIWENVLAPVPPTSRRLFPPDRGFDTPVPSCHSADFLKSRDMRASRVSGLNDAAVGQRARCCPPAEAIRRVIHYLDRSKSPQSVT